MANSSPFSLEGKVALVTGAATGIGLACAKRLALSGAKVMMTDINLTSLTAAADKLNDQEGLDLVCQHQDVTVESHWQRVMEDIRQTLGTLDILVNNAGIYIGGTLLSNNIEDIQRINQVNIESVFLGMKYAAQEMRQDDKSGRGGSIINMSSVAGLVGVPGHTAYGSTKGAVRLYTKHSAVEFAALGYGVRVNSVHPGIIDTQMGHLVYEDLVDIGVVPDIDHAKEMVRQMTPLSRMGTVDDVANMVLFLASDASSYVTGAEFVVDGGMSAA
jgi:3alpha(or 20beta)-hydroxysteroid dehydrogenase